MALPAIPDKTKHRFKRNFRRRRRNVEEFGVAADKQIERLLIRRFSRLVSVRRFVFLWLTLFILLVFCSVVQFRSLGSYYQAIVPVPGGMYSEGMVGSFSNANPLYATNTADVSVSRLIFSGLFKYDQNNRLVGDLAQGYQLDAKELRYTVNLKHGITWQDGQPFTADDVVFTYQTIQDPQAASAIYNNWQNIKVSKLNNYTVAFDLPNPLSSFPYALVNGIIPKHLLDKVPPAQLRSASFNVSPVGTGPFQWKFVEVSGGNNTEREQLITLAPFHDYYGGSPKLDGFSFHTFHDEQRLVKAFDANKLSAMSGLNSTPSSLVGSNSIQVYETPLTSAVMTFYNNSRTPLNDVNVRRGLTGGIDRQLITPLLGYPANLVNGPLLRGQIGFDSSLGQLPYDPASANQTLDGAGWLRGAGGIRYKDGKPLLLNLSSQNTPQYTVVAQSLQNQWAKLGVDVKVRYFSADDLQGQIIANHDYDMLLYGISIGVDPDVYAYWDSSQASLGSQGHLNLSEYKSASSDQALEAGRTRSDPALRAVKYRSFLSNWVSDAPALALYQPDYYYITHGNVANYQQKSLVNGAARFYNVNNWMIREQRQNL